MNTTIKIITRTVALAVLTFTADRLQAQVTNVIAISATAQTQSRSLTNGTTVTTPIPPKSTFNVKFLLGFLAQDEAAQGNYVHGATNFPAGAKLVVIDATTNRPALFQVLAANNAFLADVSDIIFAKEGHFKNDITSGTQSSTNGMAKPKVTDLHVLTLGYDDSNAIALFGDVVGLQFYLTGLMTSTDAVSKPSKAGVVTLTQASSMSNAAGEGFYQGKPFVITGSVSSAGKLALTP